MIVTYSFDTSNLDQKAELFRVQQADNYYFALLELQHQLHDAAKHQDDVVAQKWRDRFYKILHENNADLGD